MSLLHSFLFFIPEIQWELLACRGFPAWKTVQMPYMPSCQCHAIWQNHHTLCSFPVKKHNSSTHRITACVVANKLLYKRCAFSMEKENFEFFWPPHSSHIFAPIFLKLKTKQYIWDTNPHATFGKDRFTGGVWANAQILAVHSVLPFFVFFAQRSGRTARLTAMRMAQKSKRVFPVKEVHFGGLNNEK